MNISRRPDGHDATGQPQFVWQLENEQLKVVVSEYGVRLMAVYVRDKNHVQRNVVLGLAATEDYRQDTASLGAVVGRFANRIRDARYVDGSQEVRLDKNHGVHHLHGGALGFEDVLWQAAATTTGVCFTYRSVDGEQGYPGDLDVSVTLSLMGDSLGYHYQAISNRDTIINLTNHTYFNLDGAATGDGDIRNHELQIAAGAYLPIDTEVLPTGEIKAVADTAFDFSQSANIGSRLALGDEQLSLGLGFDHCFVLNQITNSDDDGALAQSVASLYSPDSGIVLEIFTSEPGLQFYTGNYLPTPHAGLCLETQHFPDSPNMPHFPSTRLAAGAVFDSTSIYRFTAK